jgi:cupin 2 domain-containing protein
MPSPPPARIGSLFSEIPAELPDERFEALIETPGFRLERILSQGQATPPGQWYDQDRDEWVLLVEGAARLSVEGRAEPVELAPGDTVLLPAHCRHRVDWTPEDRVTVWLALHFSAEAELTEEQQDE